MMYKVKEIFRSIQGEGPSVGTDAIFVRFSGCNLSCSFCDESHGKGTEMTAEDILRGVREKMTGDCGVPAFAENGGIIVLTGGEPLLQVDEMLIDHLGEDGIPMCIETNGELNTRNNSSLTNSMLRCFNEVVLSPKSPAVSAQLLRSSTCLKVLCGIDGPIVGDGILDTWSAELGSEREEETHRVLQPITPPASKGLEEYMQDYEVACDNAVSAARRLSRITWKPWRVIPQTHVFMGMR